MTAILSCIPLFLAAAPAIQRIESSPPPAQSTLQPAVKAPEAHVTRMTIHPQSPPSPALKYQLMPNVSDRTPGNAAQIYLIGFELFNPDRQAAREQFEKYRDCPISQLPVKEAAELLANFQPPLAAMELAGRRDRCDWGIPYREQGFNTLLPYLNVCRQAGGVLAVQARVQIAQGKFDDAVHTLQTGFALVDHLKNDAVLIQDLVAAGLANEYLDRAVVDLEQAPGAPNLYWALADLPKPLIGMQGPAALERADMEYSFPDLKHRNPLELNADELRSLFAHIQHWQQLSGYSPQGGQNEVTFIAQNARAYGVAQRWLATRGYAQDRIEKMPVEAVLAAYYIQTYRQESDEVFKWAALPYWQAQAGLAKAEARIEKARKEEPNPLLGFIPALQRAKLNLARSQRRVEMLQCVEGLRAYAAGHDGKLPKTLADLTDTPAPLDVITGKPFMYETTGNTATLRALPPPGPAIPEERIEITMAGEGR
ncbi:MAG TPA: hypothetical protein VFC78_20675 [Tepidisphaeraceae bacterium]|nr:hypothetical protein [Tepidisphaeraceae bacterium]